MKAATLIAVAMFASRSPAAADGLAANGSDASPSPWIDRAPAAVLDEAGRVPTRRDSKRAARLALAGGYLGLTAYTYAVWYRNQRSTASRGAAMDG